MSLAGPHLAPQVLIPLSCINKQHVAMLILQLQPSTYRKGYWQRHAASAMLEPHQQYLFHLQVSRTR